MREVLGCKCQATISINELRAILSERTFDAAVADARALFLSWVADDQEIAGTVIIYLPPRLANTERLNEESP